jgi:opacity protein-like surface antigen
MRSPTSRLVALAASFAGLLVAAPAASAADLSTSPTPLAFGTPVTVNTARFSIDSGEQNTKEFPNKCKGSFPVGVARTAWYSVQGTGSQVTVTTEGSGFDTALFVYSESPTGGLVVCNDDISGSNFQSTVTFTSTAGTTYAIQAGSACNDLPDTTNKCNPASPDTPAAGGELKITAISALSPLPPLPPPPGSPPPPPVHPSSPPQPGVKRIKSGVQYNWAVFKHYTKALKLVVRGVPPNGNVVVSCKGRGCPFTRLKSFKRKKSTVSLTKVFKNKRLPVGAVIDITVIAPNSIGRVHRYHMRPKPLPPKQSTLCLPLGSSKPQRKC